MSRQRLTILLLLLLLTVTASGALAQDAAPVAQTEQSIFLTFVPNIQFSPFYVAVEKGYFSEGGITATIQYGEEPVGVDLIASNQLQFGSISGEEIIKARANGRPIVSVYEWFQQYPIGVVVPEGSGIESVADLAGKKVGIPGRFGASYNGLIALLAANALTENDIQLEPIGFNAPDVFCVGGVEAAVVYINNEPLQIEDRIKAGECNDYTGVTVFPVSVAADMVSNGIATNEETIASNPDLVQAFVTGFDLGLRDVINNPAETYLLSAEYVENLPMTDDLKVALEAAAAAQEEFLADDPSREAIAESRAALLESLSGQFDAATLVQFHVLLNSIDLWDADQPGYSALFSWEITQEILKTMGFITDPIDLEAAFTNDFLLAA
ncbi:MAG: ABC transporter substrate-binding protein, partial [Anaerolineae bacterium]|nr:ABC transporter substrate-binding protein [Anaerolineae bacterium]